MPKFLFFLLLKTVISLIVKHFGVIYTFYFSLQIKKIYVFGGNILSDVKCNLLV